MNDYDPARTVARGTFRAYCHLLWAATWRRATRSYWLRIRERCPKCKARLIDRRLSPELAGKGCPSYHVFKR